MNLLTAFRMSSMAKRGDTQGVMRPRSTASSPTRKSIAEVWNERVMRSQAVKSRYVATFLDD